MKALQAKVLLAHFEPLNKSHPDDDRANSYRVLEFGNGLILVEGETTNDWFFEDSSEIEGCGDDCFTHTTDAEESITYSALELSRSYGGSVGEFGDYSKKCTSLVKELCH